MPTSSERKIAIIVGEQASELERFAASELLRYLKSLFGFAGELGTTKPDDPTQCLYVGTLQSMAPFPACLATLEDPELGDQEILLAPINAANGSGLLVSGGSPRAVLWAAYELIERWGVTYLLTEDVLPVQPAFHLPETAIRLQALDPLRTWGFCYGWMFGPESWGLAEYKRIIDQLAKLKFNRILLEFYPEFPHVHLQFGGIERSTAGLFFNLHIPITDEMVGRELFDNRRVFWHPDLPLDAPYAQFLEAGQRFIHAVIEHAHARGMEFMMTCMPLEYTQEFAPLLKDPLKVKLLGTETIVPGPGIEPEDSDLMALALEMFRATVDTYPESDYVGISMPEFRDWIAHSEHAWKCLDARYGIESILSYEDVLAAAARRTAFPGGGERALKEVQGDIVALYFYDRFFHDLKATEKTARPDMKLVYLSLAEELYPILSRILPPGTESLPYVDYTPLRALNRKEVFREIDAQTPYTLSFTLQDDNVGFFPMLATGSLARLQKETRASSWKGYVTRYWLTSDHDPCVSFLAHASWDESLKPFGVYRDFIERLCGAQCVYEMLGAFRELEEATALLEWDALGLGFPSEDMLMKNWKATLDPEEFRDVQDCYRRALEWALRARTKSAARGRFYADYWVDRLQFGIDWLATIAEVRRAAISESQGQQEETQVHTCAALNHALSATEAYVRAARNQSDRASIAIINHYGIRRLRDKLEQ